jgi:hypothetical protein
VACPNHAAVRAVRPLAGHASPSGEGCPATAGRVDRPGCACDSGRALVKHAGLAPREKLSGAFVGRTKLTGQGRPGLRLAAWRAARAARLSNPIYAARYRHLTTAEHNKLRPTQAQPVLAAAILRHLHAVITTGQTWDPAIAAQPNTTRTSRRLTNRRSPHLKLTVGASPPRHQDTRDLDDHHGQPRPSSDQPDHPLPGPTPFSHAGTDDRPGHPTHSLTQNTSR